MVSNVEFQRVPLPKWAAEVDVLFPRFLLLSHVELPWKTVAVAILSIVSTVSVFAATAVIIATAVVATDVII